MFLCDRGTGSQQFRGLVMSEIHRRRPRRNKFEFSFVGNDCRPSQKSGTRRENRDAPDSPDLSSSIPDDRGYLLSQVFISRQDLGQSGNGKIPDRLGFSRHMKTKPRTEAMRRTFFYSTIKELNALNLEPTTSFSLMKTTHWLITSPQTIRWTILKLKSYSDFYKSVLFFFISLYIGFLFLLMYSLPFLTSLNFSNL